MNVTYEYLEDYLNLEYAVSVYPETTGIYTIMIPRLPGCMTQGKTIEEAFKNLAKARQIWITTAWTYGNEIPLPNHHGTILRAS